MMQKENYGAVINYLHVNSHKINRISEKSVEFKDGVKIYFNNINHIIFEHPRLKTISHIDCGCDSTGSFSALLIKLYREANQQDLDFLKNYFVNI